MKKILIAIILSALMIPTAGRPAFAAETFYGPEPGPFGNPTSADKAMTVGGGPTESDNINRSKDSAIIPPPFGSPSSDMPGTGKLLTPGISGITLTPGSYTMTVDSTYTATGHPGPLPPPIPDDSHAVSGDSRYKMFTLPDGLYYSDGSVGTLSIPKLNVSAKVYEDENLENLAKGIGHFKTTSCWDGNVGLAAHNRGKADYFGKIHTLKPGDKIIYETKLGTRTYSVRFVEKVHETDLSRLGRTDINMITLITCVRDVPELRWCVRADEI